MYLPVDPPQSIKMIMKDTMVHHDRKNGRLISENLPIGP